MNFYWSEFGNFYYSIFLPPFFMCAWIKHCSYVLIVWICIFRFVSQSFLLQTIQITCQFTMNLAFFTAIIIISLKVHEPHNIYCIECKYCVQGKSDATKNPPLKLHDDRSFYFLLIFGCLFLMYLDNHLVVTILNFMKRI